MKAVLAAFNQEKALVGAFSVIMNLRMELFQALVTKSHLKPNLCACAGITSFDNIGLAMLTVFQCVTMENWVPILYAVITFSSGHHKYIRAILMPSLLIAAKQGSLT